MTNTHDIAGIVFSMDDNKGLANSLTHALGYETGQVELRQFPDGESYINVLSDVRNKQVVVLCSLDHPNSKTLNLLFLKDALADLGARSIGLVSPYLSYMRQDIKFKPGEALTSKTFASLISEHFDWLITVDPHLHRYHSLTEVYTIPATSLHAAQLVSEWVRRNANDAFLLGPDEESEQWVREVANKAGVPFGVSIKQRHGDRDVEVHFPKFDLGDERPIILIDDIISSGHTMIESVVQLKQRYSNPVWCIAVHGIFAEQADEKLKAAGVDRLVTTNSILQAYIDIDLSPLLAAKIAQLVG